MSAAAAEPIPRAPNAIAPATIAMHRCTMSVIILPFQARPHDHQRIRRYRSGENKAAERQFLAISTTSIQVCAPALRLPAGNGRVRDSRAPAGRAPPGVRAPKPAAEFECTTAGEKTMSRNDPWGGKWGGLPKGRRGPEHLLGLRVTGFDPVRTLGSRQGRDPFRAQPRRNLLPSNLDDEPRFDRPSQR
jgi:hypothetical protein